MTALDEARQCLASPRTVYDKHAYRKIISGLVDLFERMVDTRDLHIAYQYMNERNMPDIAACRVIDRLHNVVTGFPLATPAAKADPTGDTLGTVRGVLQVIRGQTGATFDDVRRHCGMRGEDMTLWPEWAMTEQGYVTEEGAARLIFDILTAAMARQIGS